MGVVTVSLFSAALPSDARSHGFAGHGMGTRGAQFAGDRHGNNAYVKAVEERDSCRTPRSKAAAKAIRHAPRHFKNSNNSI